ncbi:hypothetical protein EPUS_00259 [Endocarpon pusillum Z07020]|uniref:Mannosyltransferase n=1 Tax=Endocarpon pusillum (strain Z07020 / HMAS-L-300199) TaxID=1263415 RepID=U1FYS2_ENDPU|nr:uncharacterized protein EPUS_00259 [Endocarpon pusillum Z07020]ERF70072.1 hypothetical protein EPUS_00259 [Endocarpon pusillum Z07020]
MWRRSYLLLLLVRIYFAISPSYLHPDENFQGPEVIADELFLYPSNRTWEWTSNYPIRSVFPLWPVYGIPMTLLKWVWAQDDQQNLSPKAIYYLLRVVMFILSFVLEDWAIYELVHAPRHRRQAVILVASSYVTWTYQSHTFSNSIETLLVTWSLVLIERIVREKNSSSMLTCSILSLIIVFGIFNRITFPAFILIPGLQLLPHFLARPFSFLVTVASAVVFTCLAIGTDTAFFRLRDLNTSSTTFFRTLVTNPVITPWNNIRYNTQTSNLALHGLHPRYQHFLVNLPQLLGPALILLLTSLPALSLLNLRLRFSNPCLLSAITGTAFLSIFPHQEPRFLLPCVPLLLTCIHLPTSSRGRKWFWSSWLVFNILLGILMGVYHQGGVIPAQLQVPDLLRSSISSPPPTNTTAMIPATIFWWKTYPPPTYLLGNTAPFNISTVPLMGLSQPDMLEQVTAALPFPCSSPPPPPPLTTRDAIQNNQPVFLTAPLSSPLFPPSSASTPNASFLAHARLPSNNKAHSSAEQEEEKDQGRGEGEDDNNTPLELALMWTYRQHINLDDMDIASDVWGTLRRVVGGRGIGVWRVERRCPPGSGVESIILA